MNAQEIVCGVERALRDHDKIAQRRGKIAALAKVRREWGIPDGVRLPRHEDAVLTTDQSLMMDAGKRLKFKLLVLGHHVANVILSTDGVFELTARPRDGLELPSTPLRWTDAIEEVAAIDNFVEECKGTLRGRSPELQVQLQLVRLLANAGTKARKLEALRNLQPVIPFGVGQVPNFV